MEGSDPTHFCYDLPHHSMSVCVLLGTWRIPEHGQHRPVIPNGMLLVSVRLNLHERCFGITRDALSTHPMSWAFHIIQVLKYNFVHFPNISPCDICIFCEGIFECLASCQFTDCHCVSKVLFWTLALDAGVGNKCPYNKTGWLATKQFVTWCRTVVVHTTGLVVSIKQSQACDE